MPKEKALIDVLDAIAVAIATCQAAFEEIEEFLGGEPEEPEAQLSFEFHNPS